ncbi:Uncharacterised protein [Mycobacteroides abscessus subsp. abscessus]|nr:Uncharacterised protein [Mycobacteroides abscessus subsp. abscessus]
MEPCSLPVVGVWWVPGVSGMLRVRSVCAPGRAVSSRPCSPARVSVPRSAPSPPRGAVAIPAAISRPCRPTNALGLSMPDLTSSIAPCAVSIPRST